MLPTLISNFCLLSLSSVTRATAGVKSPSEKKLQEAKNSDTTIKKKPVNLLNKVLSYYLLKN